MGSPNPTGGSFVNRHRSEIIASLLLIIVPLAVYGQVRNHDFVNYDDQDYVTQNPHIFAGWTAEGVIWAFTTRSHGHWHPLTWLSHMTDCQLFGLNPAWHHFTSVLLHLTNILLLFWALKWTTGSVLRSAFVAALFGLHPLHVEAVAWVASRKDVLSTFFWMLTIMAYVHYSRNPSVTKYLLVLVTFTLALMAKPMTVTLPFILLLMDYWPLERVHLENLSGKRNFLKPAFLNFFHSRSPSVRLLAEKLPFLVLGGASIMITLSSAQPETTRTVNLWNLVPTQSQLTHVLVPYITYMHKMFWPLDLAVFYRHLEPSDWQLRGAGVMLVTLCSLILWKGRRFPYLGVGWLWYLITLLPVIGVIKGVPQPIADRYTYLPLVGLFVMIAWGVPDLVKTTRFRRIGLALPVGVLLCLTVCTWSQIAHWKNSVALFTHTLKKTDHRVPLLHNNLGAALMELGKTDEALFHFSEVLRINPNHIRAHYNLGLVLAKQGKVEEAIRRFSKALENNPNYAEAHNNLAVALNREGKVEEAIHHFLEAIRIQPYYAKAHYNLGLVLTERGKLEDAVYHFCQAIRILPHYTRAHESLGQAYWLRGDKVSAMREYKIIWRLDVNSANDFLGWMRSRSDKPSLGQRRE